MPGEGAGRVAAARTALDSTVTLSGPAMAFGTVRSVVLLVAGGHRPLAALTLLAWPPAWGAYRASLQAATAYGQEAAVVLDLHRHELPRHPEPGVAREPAAERRMWDDLAQFPLRSPPLPTGPQVTSGS
ncbi:hypothetical protein ACWDZ4_03105 [Streptomyces sp. NPDC003016]